MRSPSKYATGKPDPSALDDQDLLGLYAHSRDPDYLAELVQRYHGLVAAVVHRQTRDPQDFQDGIQATFLILIQSVEKIRRRTSLAAWLHGVAHRTAQRIRIRSERERLMQNHIIDDDSWPAVDESPLTLVANKIQLDALDEELQQVREVYRSVLVEHYLLGKTAAQIAARCNLSQSTIEGRLRRGRQQLRTQMLRRGFGLSAAVAIWRRCGYCESASAAELDALAEQLTACSSPYSVDLPESVSTLIAEETSMSSLITTKLSIAIFIATLSTAACGLLAVTAVGEQNGTTPTTQLVADALTDKPAASVNLVSQPSTPQASAPAAATASAAPAKSAVQAWPATATHRVRQALSQLTDVAYNAVPLQQVLAALEDDFNVGIQLNNDELESLGFDVDTLVTLELPPIPLSQALDYILSPLNMSYRVEGDVLFISAREKLDARPNLRVYDLSIFETPKIATVIEQNIRKIQPDHWTSGQWSVDVLDEHLLFISASDPAHAEIETLLANLASQLGKALPQTATKQAIPPQPKQNSTPARTSNPFGSPATGHDNPFNSPAAGRNNPFGSPAAGRNNPFGP